MGNPAVLVAFYSRTGTTKLVAEAIAQELGADLEEIVDLKDRRGMLGFLSGGKDASLKKLTPIGPVKNQPNAYRVVAIGTPVWANNMSPAVRAYLTQCKDLLPAVAFFLTTGQSGIDKTFLQMEELCGKTPVATLALKQGDIRKGDHVNRVKSFADQLRNASAGGQGQ